MKKMKPILTVFIRMFLDSTIVGGWILVNPHCYETEIPWIYSVSFSPYQLVQDLLNPHSACNLKSLFTQFVGCEFFNFVLRGTWKRNPEIRSLWYDMMRYDSWICACWYEYHIINLTLEGLEKLEFKIAESLTKLNMARPSIFNLFWSCIPILQVHAKLVSHVLWISTDPLQALGWIWKNVANLRFNNFDVQFARYPGNPWNGENHWVPV